MQDTESTTAATETAAEPTSAVEQDNYVYGAYRVISVEKMAHQESGQAGDWCRYVIGSGASRVTGIHRGGIPEVSLYAEDAAQEFNARNRLQRGKLTAWQSKKRQR